MKSDINTADPPPASDLNSDNVDAKLRASCVQGWQLHRELAAMQAALRAATVHRSVLPSGLQARPVMPRELAAPYVPSSMWHQLLVTPDYAFACSGAERIEQLQYGELQQGMQRQLRRRTEDTLRLQKLAARNSKHHSLHPQQHSACAAMMCHVTPGVSLYCVQASCCPTPQTKSWSRRRCELCIRPSRVHGGRNTH